MVTLVISLNVSCHVILFFLILEKNAFMLIKLTLRHSCAYSPTCPAWTTWLLTWIGCPAVRLPARGQRWWTCPLRPASVWSLYATPVPPSFPPTKNSFLAPERSTLLSLVRAGLILSYFVSLVLSGCSSKVKCVILHHQTDLQKLHVKLG